MTVRQATQADLAAMAQLHAQGFAERWDEAALAGLLAVPGCFGLIVERAGIAEGFILIRVAADEAEILTIAIAPSARRHGLGSQLLQDAAIRAAQMGAGQMFLEVVTDNTPASALYEKHGFRPVGHRKAYYRGSDALVLKAGLPLAFGVGKAAETL